jgi:hypothetical protein
MRIQIQIQIRIHRIYMFLGLLDPDPDSLVRGMDLDPEPFIISKNSKKNFDSCCFLISFLIFIF